MRVRKRPRTSVSTSVTEMVCVWRTTRASVHRAFMVLRVSRSVSSLVFRRVTLHMVVVCLDDVSVTRVSAPPTVRWI